MLWDPTFKPRLRPLEALPVPDGHGPGIAIHDRSGLSEGVLNLSEAALQVVALMDGANTCEDIRRKFNASFGSVLPIDTFQSMLEQLERAHFLEGTSFEAYYQTRQEAYRTAGLRPMPHAAEHGIVDDSGSLFDEMLDSLELPPLPGRVKGLVAPHLDYQRGEPCYAAAYGTLRNRPAPDRVIILGTNHFGRSTSVVATGCAFSTPLGTVRADMAFLEQLEAQCGHLRTCELDHAREHSVELQVAWLQHLFRAHSFEVVPLLCPDPCGPTGTAPLNGDGVDLRDFALAMRELVADDPHDTLFVAGADLSHVGAAFSDQRPLDDAFLEEVRQRDRRALDKLEINDPAGFLEYIAGGNNATRVCSAGCIYVLATALPDATGTVLRYHQAVDQPSQTCVTCTAVALTGSAHERTPLVPQDHRG